MDSKEFHSEREYWVGLHITLANEYNLLEKAYGIRNDEPRADNIIGNWDSSGLNIFYGSAVLTRSGLIIADEGSKTEDTAAPA